MRMDEAFYNLFNFIEYAQLTRSEPKSMIRDFEGLSRNYIAKNVVEEFLITIYLDNIKNSHCFCC